MTEENTERSAKEFDPYSFAERWLETVWPEKRPHEFSCYVAAIKRWREKHD